MRVRHAALRLAPLLASLLATPLLAAPTLAAPTLAAPTLAIDGTYFVQSAATGLNAARAGDAVVQHRPKGDEDHQQWRLRADADAYLIMDLTDAAHCLGRSADQATIVDCATADARWQVASLGAGRYTLADPTAPRYLTVNGDVDRLRVNGSGSGAAQWYLTPVMLAPSPMPLPQDRRLDQITFLTAHNAFANGVDGSFAPPFLSLFRNQVRGISQQLADGVRGLMLDIYPMSGGATLCHQSCVLTSRPVPLWADLARVVDFLNQHPTEFVTVFLEDYVPPEMLRASLARVTGLTDLLYTPDREGVRDHGWPTMGELVQRNTRLLMFTDQSRASDEAAGLNRDSFGVLYQREWTVENYWSMGSGTGSSDWSCYSRWGTGSPLTRTETGFRPLFVMNHFRDTPIPVTIATDNTKLLDRTLRFCEPAARKKPTFVAVDRYDLGDPMSAVTQLNTSWTADPT